VKKTDMTPAEQFTKDLISAMSHDAQTLEFERNDFLIQAGTVEHNIYWIERGAVRAFYLTELEEHTIRLGYRGSLITSLTSFLKGIPSELYLQAIRKTSVRALPKSVFDAFIGEDTDRLKQYNDLLQELLVQQLEREIDLLTYSPVERLQRVLARSPHLFQEVPAKYIASYLRMSPETLSRIQKS
jgi:CRP-like cAMP-binding protein